MKTMLAMAAMAVATSLAVSHVAGAQERTKRFQPKAESLVDAIGFHFQRCWFPPEGLGDQQELVVVRFGLSPDGSLRAGPTIVGQTRLRSRGFREAARAAQRAVQECTPLNGLPRASYQRWREIELVFDPRAQSDRSAVAGLGEQVRVTVLRVREPYDEFEVGVGESGGSAPSGPSSGDTDSPNADSPGAGSPSGGGGSDSSTNNGSSSTTTVGEGNVTQTSTTSINSTGGGTTSNTSVNFNFNFD